MRDDGEPADDFTDYYRRVDVTTDKGALLVSDGDPAQTPTARPDEASDCMRRPFRNPLCYPGTIRPTDDWSPVVFEDEMAYMSESTFADIMKSCNAYSEHNAEAFDTGELD